MNFTLALFLKFLCALTKEYLLDDDMMIIQDVNQHLVTDPLN